MNINILLVLSLKNKERPSCREFYWQSVILTAKCSKQCSLNKFRCKVRTNTGQMWVHLH
uniref:Uncharacterized protein n=1 Tax=Anguilla anguilla TaxID=7936 RepID=A0A0E9TMP2_ANGAN